VIAVRMVSMVGCWLAWSCSISGRCSKPFEARWLPVIGAIFEARRCRGSRYWGSAWDVWPPREAGVELKDCLGESVETASVSFRSGLSSIRPTLQCTYQVYVSRWWRC